MKLVLPLKFALPYCLLETAYFFWGVADHAVNTLADDFIGDGIFHKLKLATKTDVANSCPDSARCKFKFATCEFWSI